MYEHIAVDRRESVCILTFNRPQARNALDSRMRAEVIDALATFNADPAQRAVVITGAGDKAFSAGQDLKEAANLDADTAIAWQDSLKAFLGAIRNLDKPSVAAINGVAAGAGFYTALLCDIRVGHPDLCMGQPEVNVGFPSVIGTRLMNLTLGLAATVDLTLTGRLVDGEEAHRLGLVHELVPRNEVLDRAVAIAAELGAKPPVAMRLTKQALREMTQETFEGAIETGKRMQREAFATGEPQRMMETFLKRRT